MHTFLENLSTFSLTLPAPGGDLLKAPPHWLMYANGDADFHDNIILFGFAGVAADPVLVAKVPRLRDNGWMLQVEYDRLVELWNFLGEDAGLYLPRPYAITALQGNAVLIISHIPGQSLARLSRKSFWSHRAAVLALAVEAAHSLRILHESTATPIGTDEAIDLDFGKAAKKFADLFTLSDEEARALSALVRTVQECRRMARRKVIIQGDFWHGNMIRDRVGGRLKFIDWQFARWSVDTSMDVYFLLLAGALSASTHGHEKQRAADAFVLLSDWRKDIVPEYLSAYGVPGQFSLLSPQHGMMLCCVEKAVRPALDFGYSHSDDLMWRYLFSELLTWADES